MGQKHGSVIGTSHDAAFVSTSATSAMVTTDLTTAQNFYNETINIKDSGNDYYGNSLRLLILLYMTSNFPNIFR